VGTKIIVVVGATGNQGGGLARAILADKNNDFRVRAITRNVNSDRAKELAALGAEVIEADISDETALTKAFTGAYGAFLVTNFWEHMSPEKEKDDAGTMARAARTAALQHVIWSTLDDTRDHFPLEDDSIPTLLSSYKVPHFDAKAEADQVFIDAGVPTTFLRTTFFWEGFLDSFAPRRGADGRLTLPIAMAESELAGIAVEDVGRTAYGIFKQGAPLIGKTVSIAGEHLTGAQLAATFSKVLGEAVTYVAVPTETLRSQPFPAAGELANMFQYYIEAPEFVAARDIAYVRSLNPEVQTFEKWLTEHKGAFAPVAAATSV
jgi:uncharacterized protein YbjT (DUF2867 family)